MKNRFYRSSQKAALGLVYAALFLGVLVVVKHLFVKGIEAFIVSISIIAALYAAVKMGNYIRNKKTR